MSHNLYLQTNEDIHKMKQNKNKLHCNTNLKKDLNEDGKMERADQKRKRFGKSYEVESDLSFISMK